MDDYGAVHLTPDGWCPVFGPPPECPPTEQVEVTSISRCMNVGDLSADQRAQILAPDEYGRLSLAFDRAQERKYLDQVLKGPKHEDS